MSINLNNLQNFNYKQAIKFDKLSKQNPSAIHDDWLLNQPIGKYIVHDKNGNLRTKSATVDQFKNNYYERMKRLPAYNQDLMRYTDEFFDKANKATIKSHGKVFGPLLMASTLKREEDKQIIKEHEAKVQNALQNKFIPVHDKSKDKDIGLDM